MLSEHGACRVPWENSWDSGYPPAQRSGARLGACVKTSANRAGLDSRHAGTARFAHDHHFSHLSKTLAVAFVYLAAFGVLWVGKFIIFNSVMFVHHHHEHAHPEDDQAATAA